MISVNSTYTTILSNGGQFEWQIVNGANTWTKANIISGTIASTLFNGVSIGNTIATQLDLQLRSVTVDTSSSLIVQFRATDGTNNSSWYTKGTFFIDTLETSIYSEITKIKAFDSMLMSEYVYMLRGTWTSPTDLTVLNKIRGVMGVSLESATSTLFTNNPKTLTDPPNIGEDGTTAKEILSYIGAMRGGNWRMTADNKLQLVILSTTPTNTANIGDAVVDLDASPAETISKVRVWVSDEAYYAFPDLPITDHSLDPIKTHNNKTIDATAASYIEEWEKLSGRGLEVRIPFWCDYTLANSLYTQFLNKSYQPFETGAAFIPPQYEVGDGIQVKNTTSIIASQSISISPLAPSDAELKKDEAINSLYPYKEPFKRKTDYQVAKNAQQIASNTAQIAENAEKVNALPSIIDQQTTLITGGFGGYIKYTYLSDGTPSEMLIMDSPNESTATNIIRLNRNGIGFSTDGGTTYGTAWTIDGKFNADYIQAGTLSADRIAAGSLAITKLDSSTQTTINTASSNASTALTNAAAAQTTANSANSQEQIIYRSVASGGAAPSANTTWVTDVTGGQNKWTTVRPQYSSSYPVLYVATQRQTVAQAANSGTTCSCTTPKIDETTTVIDGGHITTGSIDANLITTGILKAITIQDTGTSPKNYWDLSTGQFVTQQGTLGGFTINDSGMVASSVIGEMMITPSTIYTQNLSPARMASMSGGQLTLSVKDSDLNWQSCMNIYALSLPNNKRNGTIAGPNNLTYINMGESSINIHMDSSLGGQEMILSGNGISFNSGNGYFSITTGTGIFTVNSHQVLEIH